MSDNKIDIFTDGACKGNPGVGGWGALLRYGDKKKEINVLSKLSISSPYVIND